MNLSQGSKHKISTHACLLINHMKSMVKYDRPDDLKQVGKHEAVLWPPDCGITEQFQGGSTSVFLRPTFP